MQCEQCLIINVKFKFRMYVYVLTKREHYNHVLSTRRKIKVNRAHRYHCNLSSIYHLSKCFPTDSPLLSFTVLQHLKGRDLLNLSKQLADHLLINLDDSIMDRFYDEFLDIVTKLDTKEITMVAGDSNRHVDGFADGYEGVHGGRYPEGNKILEFGDATYGNTFFKKTDGRLVTYQIR